MPYVFRPFVAERHLFPMLAITCLKGISRARERGREKEREIGKDVERRGEKEGQRRDQGSLIKRERVGR